MRSSTDPPPAAIVPGAGRHTREAAWETGPKRRGKPSITHQQRDHLCGPFHAARMLRDAGIAEWQSEPLDQDLVAVHAGTALPEAELGPQVPAGAAGLGEYRFELPRVEPARSGTSARGLAAAIEKLSGGALSCVPIAGPWSARAVTGLMDAVALFDVRLLANLRTGRLWGSRPPLEALVAVLDGQAVAEPPPPEWDVGHFVELEQLLRGRRGELVLVRDSYPTLGWGGVHLQPPSALAEALARGDGHEGGILVVGPPPAAGEMRRLAVPLGLEVRIWNN